jgi:hypothetical protein
MRHVIVISALLTGGLLISAASAQQSEININIDPDASPRVEFAAGRLRDAISGAGRNCRIVKSSRSSEADLSVVVGTLGKSSVIDSLVTGSAPGTAAELQRPESFIVQSNDKITFVAGADDSGTLYGSLELASRITAAGKLPADLRIADGPKLSARATCIGMQKTEYLPGRKIYEYPYTPELFPFFYDQQQWIEYLDFLLENRMNGLYLWSGHPFASLVKLKDYAYAVEVPEETFARNVETFKYITTEADKRGIKVFQSFYNIFVSKPFADKHGIDTQHAEPTPLLADYTRKSIAEFVKTYPNVGLLVCLGEALRGKDNQSYWLREVILPGVNDGVAAAGLAEQPPVVIRAHTVENNPEIISSAWEDYGNLGTMTKFNGESLTTYQERGKYQKLHQTLSEQSSLHIANVHILANLEPFRYGAVRFIRESVHSFKPRLGAEGLHLYPLSYWDWPNVPERDPAFSTQIERDWLWFEAWAYYAWNPDRDPAEEDRHWIGRLKQVYGTEAAAVKILQAYNDAGECAPRILRRFGITGGNRQTMSLGMTLHQFTDPDQYRPWKDLWESDSPPGERLQEYVRKEWEGQPHIGETPPGIIEEIERFSQSAVDAIDRAAAHVTNNRGEFERLRNDIHCIRAMSRNYAAKAQAAMRVLRYRQSGDTNDMREAVRFLESSLAEYQKLTELTKDTYRHSQSMKTTHRKIPLIGGIDGKPAYFHWTQLLDVYQTELSEFKAMVASLPAKAP